MKNESRATEFFDTVGTDTLRRGEVVNAFDTDPANWNAVAGLRLEGEFTADTQAKLHAPAGCVIVIIGPAGEPQQRPVALFDRDSKQRISQSETADLYTSVLLNNQDLSRVIRPGEDIALPLGNGSADETRVESLVFHPSLIQAGPLS